MKKIISLVCACAMLVTTFTSFVVANATTLPTITYDLNFEATGTTLDDSYDTGWDYESIHGVAPLYKATLTLKGASAKTPVRDSSNTIIAFTGALIKGFQTGIKYTSSQDVVYIASEVEAGGSVGVSKNDPSVLTASWGTAASNSYIKADKVVATWYFFEANGGEITDMKLAADANSIQKVVLGEFYDGTSKTAQTNVDITNVVVSEYPKSSDVAVTGVTLDQSAVELDLNLNGTKTATLTATVTPADATDPTVTWTSSNTDVATVDNGVVTAVGKGEATITAKAGDFSATCEVTVVDTTPATSGKGTVTTEDATDAAEWAWDTVTGAGNAVEVTVVADDTTYKKTFTLGASVENAGATKIGVILQYNPTVFTSGISITGINLVNAN